mgnify:CR=1 FL=1
MKNKLQILQELFTIIKKSKKLLPQESYTAELFMKGKEKIANKVGEEAVETITAFLLDNKDEIIEESADLIYHLFVLLEYSEISIEDVCVLLKSRMKKKKDD